MPFSAAVTKFLVQIIRCKVDSRCTETVRGSCSAIKICYSRGFLTKDDMIELLIAGCALRDLDLVKTVIEAGVEGVDANCECGHTYPLIVAVSSTQHTYLDDLIRQVWLTTRKMLEIPPPSFELVQYLLEKGADPKKRQVLDVCYGRVIRGYTALDYLNADGNQPIYQLLLPLMTKVVMVDGMQIQYNIYTSEAVVTKLGLDGIETFKPVVKVSRLNDITSVLFYHVIEEYSIPDDDDEANANVCFISPGSEILFSKKPLKKIAKARLIAKIEDD